MPKTDFNDHTFNDLLGIVTNPPANSIPIYNINICKFDFLQPVDIFDCKGVRECIDCAFIGSILTSSDSSIDINDCDLGVTSSGINDNISASFDGICELTIGALNPINLCGILGGFTFSFFDGSKTIVVKDGSIINVVGLQGMRNFVNATDRMIGLPQPVPAQNGAPYQPRNKRVVLTWDGDVCRAVRREIECCPQTVSFNCQTKVLTISSLTHRGSGETSLGNSVDLSCINTDSQQLSLNGSMLCLDELNGPGSCVDLDTVNNQTLSIEGSDEIGYTIKIDGGTGCCENSIFIDLTQIDNCGDIQECMEAPILALYNQLKTLQMQVLILFIQLLRRKFRAHRWLDNDIVKCQPFNGTPDPAAGPYLNIAFQSFSDFNQFDGFGSATVNMNGPATSIRIPRDGVYSVFMKGNTIVNHGVHAFRVILVAVDPVTLDYKVMLDRKLGADTTTGSRAANDGMYKDIKEYHINSTCIFKIKKDRLVLPVIRVDSNTTWPLFNPCGGNVDRPLNTTITCSGSGSCSLLNNTVTLPPIPPCPPAYPTGGGAQNYPGPYESGGCHASLEFKAAGLASGTPGFGTDLSDNRSGWMFGLFFVNRLKPSQVNTP